MKSALIGLSIVSQFICIIIYLNGGFNDQTLTSSKNILASACNSTVTNDTPGKWYYTKGKGSCEVVDMFIYDNKIQDKVHQVVYTIEISLPNNELYYSRWQENIIGILNFDIIYNNHIKIPSQSSIVFDMNMAYRDKGDDYNAWKYYTSSSGERTVECSICNEGKHYKYDCMPLSLFDFYLLNHDYYLINIRFPLSNNEKNVNIILSQMTDLWLKIINRSGIFIKYLIVLKAIFFGLVSIAVIWYWRRIQLSTKSPTLLQYILLILTATLLLLNIPLEYLILYWDIPVMSMLNDIKQGIFTIALLSFLLIFIYHLTISDYYHTNNFEYYCKLHLGAVTIGYLSLFIVNIIIAEILAGFYLLFILRMIRKILIKINIERRVLPIINIIQRLNCEDLMCRLRYILIATFICASLTIGECILRLIIIRQKKWQEDYKWENNEAFSIGIHGMWNIYIITLLCVYASSRKKKWPVVE